MLGMFFGECRFLWAEIAHKADFSNLSVCYPGPWPGIIPELHTRRCHGPSSPSFARRVCDAAVAAT